MQHEQDLRRVKIAVGRLRVAGDAVFGEHGGYGQGIGKRAHQDRDVTVPERDFLSIVIPQAYGLHELKDLLRDAARLEHGFSEVLDEFLLSVRFGILFPCRTGLSGAGIVPVPGGTIDQEQRDGAGLSVITGNEHGGVVIDEFVRVLPHQREEELVDRVEHLGGGAEVVLKIDPPSVRSAKAVHLVPEERRLRSAEAVDALLDVTHVEKVVPPGDPGDNRVVETVRILVFIHRDEAVSVPVLFRDPFVLQDLQREAAQIRVVHGVVFPLELRERRDDFL